VNPWISFRALQQVDLHIERFGSYCIPPAKAISRGAHMNQMDSQHAY